MMTGAGKFFIDVAFRALCGRSAGGAAKVCSFPPSGPRWDRCRGSIISNVLTAGAR